MGFQTRGIYQSNENRSHLGKRQSGCILWRAHLCVGSIFPSTAITAGQDLSSHLWSSVWAKIHPLIKPAIIGKPLLSEQSLPATLNPSGWSKLWLKAFFFRLYPPKCITQTKEIYLDEMRNGLKLCLSFASNPKETCQVYKYLSIIFLNISSHLVHVPNFTFLSVGKQICQNFKKNWLEFFPHTILMIRKHKLHAWISDKHQYLNLTLTK